MDVITVSLYAALIGGGCTLAGAVLAYYLESCRNTRKENENLKAICHGLHDEISLLRLQYQQAVGNNLDKLKVGEGFYYEWPVNEDYFTFYHANVDKISHLPDSELRRLIIQTYQRLKGLVDSFQLNNKLIEKLEAERLLQGRHNIEVVTQRIKDREKTINDYGSGLLFQHKDSTELMDDLIERLEANF